MTEEEMFDKFRIKTFIVNISDPSKGSWVVGSIRAQDRKGAFQKLKSILKEQSLLERLWEVAGGYSFGIGQDGLEIRLSDEIRHLKENSGAIKHFLPPPKKI